MSLDAGWTFDFDALGTHWVIELSGQHSDISKIVLDRVRKFESDYSRFLDGSLLSELNNSKKYDDPPEEFIALLRYGVKLYKDTKGLFDMSVGAELEALGYGHYSSNTSRADQLEKVIKITNNEINIAESTRLDFGGFGKGWLIDGLHWLLVELGQPDHVINGGGDILVGAAEQKIVLEHPINSNEQIGELLLKGEGFASSSNQKRRWKTRDGVDRGHIIDARDDVLQVYVRAATCVQADALATTLMIAPTDQFDVLARKIGGKFLVVFRDMTTRQTSSFFRG